MDLEAVQQMEEKRDPRLASLLDYGSLQTQILSEWNKDCPTCERIRSNGRVQSLEDLCLRAVVRPPYRRLGLNLPACLYSKIMRCALMCEPGAVENILKVWPSDCLSLADILNHNLQCYSKKQMRKFALRLLIPYLALLPKLEVHIDVMDVRGAVFLLGDAASGRLWSAVECFREDGLCDGTKHIMMDAEITDEYSDDDIDTLSVNPKGWYENHWDLRVHLCHLRFNFDVRFETTLTSTMKSTCYYSEASRLKSLCITDCGLGNSELQGVMSELLKLKYENLTVLNLAGNSLDFSCTVTTDLVIRCLGSLPQLQSLNLSDINLAGKLKCFLEVLKNNLLDLRLRKTNLNSSDFIYLRDSNHSGSLLALDVGKNSFDATFPLETFFAAFPAVVAVTAEDCTIRNGNLSDLLSGFRSCRSLLYTSVRGTVSSLMEIAELRAAIQELCLCRSLKIVAFRSPAKSRPPEQRKSMIDRIEDLVVKYSGQFRVKWM